MKKIQRVATGWTFWGSTPGEGKRFYILYTRPEWRWGSPRPLHNKHRRSLPVVKPPGGWGGGGVDHQSTTISEAKNE